MMAAMTSIKNFALLGGTPSEVLERANDDLTKRDLADMFVTVWIGIPDIQMV